MTTDGLYLVYLVRAEHTAAHAAARQLLTLAKSVKDHGLLLNAHFATAFTFFYLGDFVSSREHCEAGIALYDPQQYHAHVALNRRNPSVWGRSMAARTLWFLGYPDQALTGIHEALALAQESLHPFSLAYALNFVSWVHQFRREGQAAEERAEALIALCKEHGFPFYLTYGTVMRGWALAAQGQAGEGIAEIRHGLATSRATGSEMSRSSFLGMLAEAQRQAGQAEEGLATVAEALVFVNQTEERFYEAEIYRLKGALTLQSQTAVQQSDVEVEAEKCFQKSIDVARHQQATSWELRTATSLARLWQQQGKQAEAHQLLSEIYNWFTEGFDTKDLQEAKTLLEELG